MQLFPGLLQPFFDGAERDCFRLSHISRALSLRQSCQRCAFLWRQSKVSADMAMTAQGDMRLAEQVNKWGLVKLSVPLALIL